MTDERQRQAEADHTAAVLRSFAVPAGATYDQVAAGHDQAAKSADLAHTMTDRERELTRALLAAKADHLARVVPIYRELAELAGKPWSGIIWAPTPDLARGATTANAVRADDLTAWAYAPQGASKAETP